MKKEQGDVYKFTVALRAEGDDGCNFYHEVAANALAAEKSAEIRFRKGHLIDKSATVYVEYCFSGHIAVLHNSYGFGTTKAQLKKTIGEPAIDQFPNGFKSWNETHYEVAAFIGNKMADVTEDSEIQRTNYTQGSFGLYDLALEWTNEFELKNKGREWDGEFFDEIELFCEQKNNTQ